MWRDWGFNQMREQGRGDWPLLASEFDLIILLCLGVEVNSEWIESIPGDDSIVQTDFDWLSGAEGAGAVVLRLDGAVPVKLPSIWRGG